MYAVLNDNETMFKKNLKTKLISSNPAYTSVERTVVSESRGRDAKTMAEQKANAAGDIWRAKTEANDPKVSEFGGPKGLEPTRYGDWERAGRCIDF